MRELRYSRKVYAYVDLMFLHGIVRTGYCMSSHHVMPESETRGQVNPKLKEKCLMCDHFYRVRKSDSYGTMVISFKGRRKKTRFAALCPLHPRPKKKSG